MSRRKTLDELMAEEEREAREQREQVEAWRDSVQHAAGYVEASDEALEWLRSREPNPDRAALVLMAWEMSREFPDGGARLCAETAG